MKITIGDFKEFGAIINDKKATFTFAVSTMEPCKVHLFDDRTKKEVQVIDVPTSYRKGLVYSVCVSGISFEHLCYLIERDGELTMDEYARVVVGREKWMDESRFEHDYRVYGGFLHAMDDWDVEHEEIAPEDVILYKLHMRGFTMEHGVSASRKGNFRGFLQRLDELCDMGVNTLEFMPLYEFEEVRYHSHLAVGENQKTYTVYHKPYGTNYWGYGPGCYFAPKSSYFGGPTADLNMKEMIREIHSRGMEIIMEISFEEYTPEDNVVDALLFWFKEYHVDGFHLLGANLPMERICRNPYLGTAKLFYNNFPQHLLYEDDGPKHLFVYDDQFLYPMRRLQNHMDGSVSEFTNLMRRQGEHFGFVNYAACNTGFTLWDVYSYGEKHNDLNGEDNTDGNNYNCSNNHGFEGESNNRVINKVRLTCVRTALATVLFSQGIPMIMSGDEILNSQRGNNNPYCQDNSIGWVNFNHKKLPKEMREYVKHLIAFRKTHTTLASPLPMHFTDYKHLGMPDISYHGREPWIMGIGAEKKAIGILYNGLYGENGQEEDVMLCFNFYYGEETFALPKLTEKRQWHLVSNTSTGEWDDASPALQNQSAIIVSGGSLSILVGRPAPETKKPAVKIGVEKSAAKASAGKAAAKASAGKAAAKASNGKMAVKSGAGKSGSKSGSVTDHE